MTVELQESTKTLAEIVDFASTGEEVVVMRDGKPVAKVTSLAASSQEKPPRTFGFLKGRGFKVPDDFDEMGREEIEKMFYGEE